MRRKRKKEVIAPRLISTIASVALKLAADVLSDLVIKAIKLLLRL